jgi:hypothetical protein
MTRIQDSRFGTIDHSVPGSWSAAQAYAGREVTFDLSIQHGHLDGVVLQGVLARVADLSALDAAARAALRRDLVAEDSHVETYFDHHVAELDDAELLKLFGTAAREEIAVDSFFERLALVRVGLYPERADAQLLLDYSLGPDVTNYVLCLAFDAQGAVVELTIES